MLLCLLHIFPGLVLVLVEYCFFLIAGNAPPPRSFFFDVHRKKYIEIHVNQNEKKINF